MDKKKEAAAIASVKLIVENKNNLQKNDMNNWNLYGKQAIMNNRSIMQYRKKER